MDGALMRLKALFSFNTIVDIGAAKGKWTEKRLSIGQNPGNFSSSQLKNK